jgi:DnaJ-domain-containing protein 1
MARITKKRIQKSSHKRRSFRKNYHGSGLRKFFGRFFGKKTTQTQMEPNIPQQPDAQQVVVYQPGVQQPQPQPQQQPQPQVKKSSRVGRFFKGLKNVFTKKNNTKGVAASQASASQSRKPQKIDPMDMKNTGLISIGVPLKDLKQIPGYLQLKEIRAALDNKKISEDEQTLILLLKYMESMEPPMKREDIIRIQQSTDPKSKTVLKNVIDNIPKQISEFLKEEKLRQYPRLFIGNGYNNRNKSSNYLTFVKNLKFLLNVFKLTQQRFFTDSDYPIDNINNSNLIINNHIKKVIKNRRTVFIKKIIPTEKINFYYENVNKQQYFLNHITYEDNIKLLKAFEIIDPDVTVIPEQDAIMNEIKKKVKSKHREINSYIEIIKQQKNLNSVEIKDWLKKIELLKRAILIIIDYLNSYFGLNIIVPVETELYYLLNVQYDASTQEIIKAHRQLALKEHPDKCPDRSPEGMKCANEKLALINYARDVLTDSPKRAIYDKHGKKGLDIFK